MITNVLYNNNSSILILILLRFFNNNIYYIYISIDTIIEFCVTFFFSIGVSVSPFSLNKLFFKLSKNSIYVEAKVKNSTFSRTKSIK